MFESADRWICVWNETNNYSALLGFYQNYLWNILTLSALVLVKLKSMPRAYTDSPHVCCGIFKYIEHLLKWVLYSIWFDKIICYFISMLIF